jgi:hypothetical protein
MLKAEPGETWSSPRVQEVIAGLLLPERRLVIPHLVISVRPSTVPVSARESILTLQDAASRRAFHDHSRSLSPPGKSPHLLHGSF